MTTTDRNASPYRVTVFRACKERNLWSVGLIQETGVVVYFEAIDQLEALEKFNKLDHCWTLAQQDMTMTELIEA